MPRHNRAIESLIPGYGKIRKRGCSSSSSSSSKVRNYRLKRAILAGKTRVGSRSSTPMPTWMLTPSRLASAAVQSPERGGGRSRPVSARKLAATLWEMNEVPSPGLKESLVLKREKVGRERVNNLDSGSLPPPHLSDPSHSPVSERMDRSGVGSYHQRASSISHRRKVEDHKGEVFDVLSNVSFMEIEKMSRAQTPSESTRSRLKDVSNALSTSKELLKIIDRMWSLDNQSSSTMSLISALHGELDRARLQVNKFIKEHRIDQSEINHLLKSFAEEKAMWKKKQHQAIESAVKSVAEELEAERKLRCRLESFNKKLGTELAQTKASYLKAVRELESEKRAREIMEQVCNELAMDINEDRAEAVELKRESAKVHEEVEREREMLQIADKLREERVQMKLLEAKHHFGEKNALVNKLRSQLDVFLGKKRKNKKKAPNDPSNLTKNDEATARLNSNYLGACRTDENDDGEVENGVECEEDSGESDLHSIELNMENNNKSFNWVPADSQRISVEDERKGRNFASSKVLKKSTSLLRSISDVVEWESNENEKQSQRRSYEDEMRRYKSVKGLIRDHVLSGSKAGSEREFPTPARGLSRPAREPSGSVIQEKLSTAKGSGSKSRLIGSRVEGQNGVRKSKR